MPVQKLLQAATLCAALAAVAEAQPPALYQQTQYQGREIGKLTGDVYYARMDDYLSAFVVSPEGVVLVEPVGTDFATWLKDEIKQRFDVPVKYVIYSHSHADHASGAAVFADTAEIIGHESLVDLIAMPPADTPLPENVRAQDTNGNGVLERSEAQQGQVATLFELFDANDDGVLSGAEVTRGPLKYVVAPTRTYTDRLDIELGGKRVEVISIPTDHAPDNTVVRFVDGTNVVFASDWITNGRVPFGPNIALPSELEKIRLVEAMDFEHFVCSHGLAVANVRRDVGLRAEPAVRDAVAKAVAEGKSLEEARDTVLMEDYRDWEFYEQQRPLNVTGTYRLLTANR
jgi:glyoxylase-like metal-dependent hydrolase (beta-lactamase superfamily II)